MKEGAPEIHEGCERNMNVYRQIEWGDVEEAFEECDHIREDTFYCSSQAHSALETHCAIASYSHDHKLTVWTSTQSPYYTQVLLSDALGLREGDIKVIKPHMGGGFGGKLSLDSAQFCASLLSMKPDEAVKIVLTRAEEFAATKRRTPIHYQMKLGARRTGRCWPKKSGLSPTAGRTPDWAAQPSISPVSFHPSLTNILISSTTVFASTRIRKRHRPAGASERLRQTMPRNPRWT